MGTLLKIFGSGKEQKLLDMLYGSRNDRDYAVIILSKQVLGYCFRTGRKMGFCREDTLDLFQDAMLAFMESIQEKNINENPAGYLKRIIKFKSIDRLNKKKDLLVLNQEMPEPSTTEDDEHKEVMELTEVGINKMLKAMDFINPMYKTLLESYYFFKMSVQQIADEQQISYDTVKTQLSRARKALRDKLREL